MMHGLSPEQLVLQASKSNELRAEFERLATATDSHGDPKFPKKVCDKLGTLITCRNYSRSVLQLCHLVRIARLIGGAQDYLFSLIEMSAVRTDHFRVHLAERLAPQSGLALSEAGIEVRYADGNFLVHFRQMPLLSALLEFCVNTLELPRVAGIFDEMLEGKPRRSKVSTAANRLSALLYGYLKAHLAPVHEQRKHRHLIHFLEKRCAQDFGAEQIDDDVVVDFWCHESLSDNPFGTDFRMFVTVYKSFALLLQTLERGRALYALEHPISIGTRREEGEADPGMFFVEDEDEPLPPHLHPEVIQAAVERLDGPEDPLQALAEHPMCKIKFLNRIEQRLLGPLVENGNQAQALPLSCVRAEVFGPAQHRVSRAPGGERDALIQAGPLESYDDYRAQLERLSNHLDRVLLASAHILRSAREIAEGASQEVADLDQWRQAREAFRRLNREGFDVAAAQDPRKVEAFTLATEPLVAIRALLTRFRERLAEVPDWNEQWRGDKGLFADQFIRLYGEAA